MMNHKLLDMKSVADRDPNKSRRDQSQLPGVTEHFSQPFSQPETSSSSRPDVGRSAGDAEKFKSPLGQESSLPVGGGLFGNLEAMNKELYANLDEKEYNVEDYYHETGVIQAIARSDAFNQVTLSVIAVNAVWIGIDSDHNNAQPPELHF